MWRRLLETERKLNLIHMGNQSFSFLGNDVPCHPFSQFLSDRRMSSSASSLQQMFRKRLSTSGRERERVRQQEKEDQNTCPHQEYGKEDGDGEEAEGDMKFAGSGGEIRLLRLVSPFRGENCVCVTWGYK